MTAGSSLQEIRLLLATGVTAKGISGDMSPLKGRRCWLIADAPLVAVDAPFIAANALHRH
ncbi:hypothetical protein Lser_V15G11357 [Lactuca serriola]